MKIAFAAIIKGTDEEADLLSQLLASVRNYVDAAYITITQKNDRVEEVAKFYDCNVSYFEWCNDFAKARNYNFSQVPGEFDYILWADADDTFKGLSELKQYIIDNPADAYAMYYHYEFDKYGLPTVVHPKTQVVKNDGTFKWAGKIHEDLQTDRDISLLMLDGVVRVHHTTNERANQSAQRNMEIAKENMTGDPRDHWNLANAYIGKNEYKNAIEQFKVFLDVSGSEIERYTAMLRVAMMYLHLGDTLHADEYARKAIAVRYDFPDAYYMLGAIQKQSGDKYEAIQSILEGMKKKPPVRSSIVFNPRDYDYNPLMQLASLYWDIGKAKEARVCIEKCIEVQPENENLEAMLNEAKAEEKLQKTVFKHAEVLQKLDGDEFMRKYNSLRKDVREHPILLQIKNIKFVRTETSGKDITYYCGQTPPWTPDTLKTKGVGGSEEAVINLAREWAKNGYNVIVYNNCTEETVYDGVLYRPWYLFNYRDKQDILVLWRSLRMLDYDINASKIFVDVHDAISPAEFLPKRLDKITKVMLKSKAHRDLFPNIPGDKVVIVPNGIDMTMFDGEKERDIYHIINTSSPDRSLSALVRIFPKIKAKEPRARMSWAYGWDIFDIFHKKDKEKMEWKQRMVAEMERAGIENMEKIDHKRIAELNMSAGVYLYPTHFYEIDCVSVRKAQIAGCMPVTSDFAALKTTNKHGIKVKTSYDKDNWCPLYAFDFADDESLDDEYVEAVLHTFKHTNREQMQVWGRMFTPEYVAGIWIEQFKA